MNTIKESGIDGKLLKCAGRVSTTAVRIYNIIRLVGEGELSADNALHRLIEDYKCLNDVANEIIRTSDRIGEAELELAKYKRAFEQLVALGPSATPEAYIAAVCRAEAIINGGEGGEA